MRRHLWSAIPAAVIILVIIGMGIRVVMANFQSDVHLNQASVYSSNKRYGWALHHLDRAIALRPNSVEAYYTRGYVFFQKSNVSSALSDYTTVNQLAPNYVNLDFNLATCYFKQKDWYSTILAAERSHQLFPDYASPLLMLANCYYYIRKPGKAIEYCNALLEINPTHSRALKLKAHLKSILNRK